MFCANENPAKGYTQL